MNDLKAFLRGLNDPELAVFIAYRLDDFMEKSQQKILQEVKKRGLSGADLNQLSQKGIKRKANSAPSCLRCGSDRLFTETDYELAQNADGRSCEMAVESKRCRICGFNPDKSPQKGLLHKIKKALGFYHEKRRKKPEMDGTMFT